MTRRERIETVLAGGEADRVPASFWRHYYEAEGDARSLAGAMIAHQERYDWDLIKLNPRAGYHDEAWGNAYRCDGAGRPTRSRTLIGRAEDLEKVQELPPDHGPLGEQLEALRLVAARFRGEVPLLMTVFTPLAVLGRLAGGAAGLKPFLAAAPAAVHRALAAVSATFANFAAACREAGADGLFFATTEWATELAVDGKTYAEFGRPYDLKVLEAAAGAPFNLLHVCRDRNFLKDLSDYPVAAFNWDAHGSGNPDLAAARAFTARALVGGIDHQRELVAGDPAALTAAAAAARGQTGGRGWILGAGCTYDPAAPEAGLRALRAWVEGKA